MLEEVKTDPEQAQQFAQETHVDTFAVSVGNVQGLHKLRKGKPLPLDVNRLREIHRRLPDLPLVLHGASGLPATEIELAIKHGVHIINYDTEIRVAFTDALRATLKQNPEEADPRKLLEPSTDAVKTVVEEKLAMVKSSEQAKNFRS